MNWFRTRHKMIRRISAYVLLGLGVAGLALPLLPGIPLLILGVALLEPNHPLKRKLGRWISRRNEKGS